MKIDILLSVLTNNCKTNRPMHDEVIKWKHFPRYWPFVRGIHRLSVNSPHKGQWRGALMIYLIYARINGWANDRDTGDLKSHRAHCDVTVMGVTVSIVLLNSTQLRGQHFPVSSYQEATPNSTKWYLSFSISISLHTCMLNIRPGLTTWN